MMPSNVIPEYIQLYLQVLSVLKDPVEPLAAHEEGIATPTAITQAGFNTNALYLATVTLYQQPLERLSNPAATVQTILDGCQQVIEAPTRLLAEKLASQTEHPDLNVADLTEAAERLQRAIRHDFSDLVA